MSYSQVPTMAGPLLPHSEQSRLQARLQVLVQELQWSYVALWSLNPQTRNLEYLCGHWQHTDTHDRNENFFNFTFKFCQFGPHCGSAAMAYAKGSNVWMYGPSVLENAGSEELAEFLRRARISTAIFIPWTEGVLELGTCENFPENLGLMEEIRRWFLRELVTMSEQQASGHSRMSQAISSFPLSSLPMMQPSFGASLIPLRHLSDNVNTQTFEPHSLIQQIFRRSASASHVSSEDAEGKEVGMNTDNMLLPDAVDAASRISYGVPAVPARAAAGMVQTAAKSAYYPPVPGRTRGPDRSRSGTTSSSVSSLEEAVSTRLSGDSPEQNVFLRTSSQPQPSHSNTSSPPRRCFRGTSSHSPEQNQLADTIRTTPSLLVTHENQLDAIRLMLEGEPPETGTYSFPFPETAHMSHMNLLDSGTNNPNNGNPHQSASNGTQRYGGLQQQLESKPFKPWRQARVQAQKKPGCPSQDLLRRCFDMMKQISHVTNKVPVVPTDAQPVMHNLPAQHGSRLASSSSPETVAYKIAHDPFDPAPPRGQRRPRGGSRSAIIGAVHHGHDEAAMTHMMAERRRRERQKENFAALRNLVPIISKADKASILGDAIIYLKQLETRIEELEAGSAQSQRKYETLQKSYNELEQRNKELESMVPPTRLPSMHSL